MEKKYRDFLIVLFSIITNMVYAQQGVNDTYSTPVIFGNNNITYRASNSITFLSGFSVIPTGTQVFSASIDLGTAPLLSAPSVNMNYVLTNTIRKEGIKDPALIGDLTVRDVNQQIEYYDGLGRKIQIVTTKGSPGYKDIIQPIEFDALGRETRKFLAYTDGSTPGSYRNSALVAEQGVWSFYQTSGQMIPTTSKPYSESYFEPSQLNRIIEQGAPDIWDVVKNADGVSTQTGHTVKIEYSTNNTIPFTDLANCKQVRLYTITYDSNNDPVLNYNGSAYNNNELYVTIRKDENWNNGRQHTSEEYQDKQGRIILKRVFDDAGAMLSTYFVYDDFDNLCFVLPPAATPDDGVTTTERSNFCYEYRYDGRNRIREKKIPGKDWEYMIYNKLDMLVLTQDGNQRASKQWNFTKYDAVNRVVSTGKYVHASIVTQSQMQAIVNTVSSLYESRPVGSDYSNVAFPTTGVDQLYVVNYYDDYSFPQASSYPYQTDTLNAKSDMVRGLITGSKVNILGSSNFLVSVNYYDREGRVIQIHNQNYVGGKDIINTKYSFVDQPLVVKRVHTGLNELTVINWNEYDHTGRKLIELQKINSEQRIILSDLKYNELGQLIVKKLHSIDRGNNFIQKVDYSYNIRGWLKTINDASLSVAEDKFGMELKYEDGSNPQFNGNISSMLWKGTKYTSQLSYSYDYDALNRLKNAVSGNGTYTETIGLYDKMGNILSLNRSNNVDHLTYTYSGNQLSSVNESLLENNLGQLSGTTNYSYDLNGNMYQSSNANNHAKDLLIVYNHLNLPQQISVNGQNITYIYDAQGKKLKKVAGTNITWYIDGIQYKDNVIEFIQTSEGKAINAAGAFNYSYNLTDHLGNVRVSLDKNGSVIQETNYYPFGLEIQDASKNYVLSAKNKYLYNGKELQDEFGLNQYDYGTRFYDPVIARWNVVDPLSEKFLSVNSYTYCLSNPVRFIDPDGAAPDDPVTPGAVEIVHPNIRTAGFVLRHPSAAFNIGTPSRGSTNISTIAVRFSTRIGLSENKQHEGSQVNAFRHVLWQSIITKEYGLSVAKQIGAAHEWNPRAINGSNLNLFQPTLAKADETIDLLNNQIGRIIGLENPNANIQELAMKTLNYYRDFGIYTAEPIMDKNGKITGYKIVQNKLNQSQYNKAGSIIMNLNENGRTTAEQQKIDNTSAESSRARAEVMRGPKL